MTKTEATATVFLTALRALPAKERDAVVAGLARDPEIVEDLLDIALALRRSRGPTVPLEDGLRELRDGARRRGPAKSR